MFRSSASLAFTAGLIATLSSAALAQQQAAPPAPSPAPAQDPNAAAAQQFSVNQNVGDWVVRCVQTTQKSPAPCEVIQTTINKDTRQPLSSFSIAYVPSRDAYAMQIVVPTGVSLAKGLTLGGSPNGMRFNRCEREGCYVEAVIDNTTIASITAAGKSTTIGVTSYGPKGNEVKLPVSLTGFPEALDRMKGFAKDRAVALPNNASVLPPVAANANSPPSLNPPAAAAPAPARGAARPGR